MRIQLSSVAAAAMTAWILKPYFENSPVILTEFADDDWRALMFKAGYVISSVGLIWFWFATCKKAFDDCVGTVQDPARDVQTAEQNPTRASNDGRTVFFASPNARTTPHPENGKPNDQRSTL